MHPLRCVLQQLLHCCINGQVSAVGAMIATVYMRVFLPESIAEDGVSALHSTKGDVNISLLDEDKTSVKIFKTMPSFDDSVSLLRSR